jgi:uncharacterized membrane protein
MNASEAPPSRAWVIRALGSGAMLGLLGSVAVARFDLVPAALTVAGLFAVVNRRFSWAGCLLGAGIAVKVFPLVVVPLVLVRAWRHGGLRSLTGFAAPLAATVMAAFLPFLIFAPEGIERSFSLQLERPLQIESIAASLLWLGRQVGIAAWPVQPSYFNLAFPQADVAAAVSTVVGIVVLGYLWVQYARADSQTSSLMWSAFACVATFLVFAKVLSPQFLLWVVVMVPALRGSHATLVGGLLGVAVILTTLYFPRWFVAAGAELDALWLSVIVLRNALLVAMLYLAIREATHPTRRLRTEHGG